MSIYKLFPGEWMRKPVYLGVLGMAIAVSAVSIGVTLTRYLSLRAYSPKTPALSAGAPSESASPPLPVEEWRNLFSPSQGMKTPSRLPAAAGKGTAPASRSNFVLVGTIVSSTPSARRAILWAEGMKEPRAYRESEEVEPGAVVAAVERDKIYIARGNEREKLDLLPVGSRSRAPASPPAAPQPSAAQVSSQPAGDIRVTRLSDSQFSIDEGGVAQLTGNFNQFMTQVRLVPYFEGNKSAGYRIAAVRPGTTFEKLGFQGGDVLQQVNGLDVSSPDKMYTIFQNLKDEKKVTVSILRQGQKSTLTYEIR
jgi:general secretion pathway protein C